MPNVILTWLTNTFQIDEDLNESDIESIQNFSLLWNVFEANYSNRNFQLNTIEVRINQATFDIQDYQTYLEYFRNRYVTNGQLNQRFPHLRVPNNRNQLLTEVLLNNNPNLIVNQIVLALTIIVYRYRNNLFHGEKDIRRIRFQRDNFAQSNGFLMKIMDDL